MGNLRTDRAGKSSLADMIRAYNDGCDVVDRCTECPLRQCRFDDGVWFQRQVVLAEAVMLSEMRDRDGLTPDLIARQVGRPQRSVLRSLARLRDAGEVPSGLVLEALLRVGKTKSTS